MMRGPGPTDLLGRALAASAARAGARIDLADGQATPWHSATFTGARHAFAAQAPTGYPLGKWLAMIGDTDLPLPGHLVADVAITAREECGGLLHFRIEALTVESENTVMPG
ncbi:hypothetical protein [Sphingomonas radiodurans]|uniref:hypothetical protein n=1 Tax=Sphingomonas radiodurans TaxID=2890321 RepID=UPI001E5E7925|nr:hypothetical protein [Sphingomonas radiodurans]WBH17255.1 hypothetical protein LLW23_03865 [Sphingomonas radiodurans]